MQYSAIIAISLSVIVLANGLCQRPTIQQRRDHYWEENGKHYSLWYVRIYNPEQGDPLTKIYMDLHPRDPLPVRMWGLGAKDDNNKRFTFPSFVSDHEGVAGGNYHEFGYIAISYDRSYSPLSFTLYDYACPADDDYNPVCGEDGKTYGNACVARCNGFLKEKDGEC